MSSDLNAIGGARPPTTAAPPAPPAAGAAPARPQSVPQASESAPTPSAASRQAGGVVLRPPEPAELAFDANEMQRNLDEAIARLNEQMVRNGRDLNFSVDKVVDRTVVTVRSSTTGEVVRQIPNDTVLKVAHNIEDIKGLLLNADA